LVPVSIGLFLVPVTEDALLGATAELEHEGIETVSIT
jgi:hypothetical protein